MKVEYSAVIRFMEESDVLQVKEIERECELSVWSESDYKEELSRKNSLTLVLVKNERIIGFLIVRLITIKNDDQSGVFLNSLEAEIYNVAIKLQYQNQGYGQQLFNKFFEICLSKNVKEIWLEVRKSNNRAIDFYTRNSFKFAYLRKNFYTFPVEDAVVLKLTV